jgi:hypothetical protein
VANQTVQLNYTKVNSKLVFIPDIDPIRAEQRDTIEFQLGNVPDGAQFVLQFEQPSFFSSALNRMQNTGLLQSGDGDLTVVAPSGKVKYHCRLFHDGKELPTDENPGGEVIIGDGL